MGYFFKLIITSAPNVVRILEARNSVSPKSMGGFAVKEARISVTTFEEESSGPLLPHLTLFVKKVIELSL